MQRTLRTFPRLLVITLGLVASLAMAGSAHAQDSGFGLGGVVGDPTGLSLKGYVGPTASIDGGVGLGLITEGNLSVYADFLWERHLKQWDRAGCTLYFGVGPKVGLYLESDEFRVGARAPVGPTFQFTRRPLDVFVELAAGLWFYEDAEFDLDLGAGARYWF